MSGLPFNRVMLDRRGLRTEQVDRCVAAVARSVPDLVSSVQDGWLVLVSCDSSADRLRSISKAASFAESEFTRCIPLRRAVMELLLT